MGCSASHWTDVRDDQLKKKLSEHQVQVIRDTWSVLSDDMEETGLLIFVRLFQSNKDIKHLFVNMTVPEGCDMADDITIDEYLLKKHSTVVMEALGAAVECLDDSALLANILVALGQIHAGYNVKPHYLPRLWPAIRHGFKEILQDRFTEEVESTWKIVFCYIISRMKDGMRMGKKSDGTDTAGEGLRLEKKADGAGSTGLQEAKAETLTERLSKAAAQ